MLIKMLESGELMRSEEKIFSRLMLYKQKNGCYNEKKSQTGVPRTGLRSAQSRVPYYLIRIMPA